MRRIFAALLAALLSFPPAPFAARAEEGTAGSPQLPQLLREMDDANPDLLAARKRLEAARARIPLAKGLPAPRVGIEFWKIPRGTVKVNRAEAIYSLLQSLPFPGKLSLRQRVAVAQAQSAAADFKRTEWDLETQMKSVYYDLFLVDRESEIEREQRGWIDQVLSAAQAGYAAGVSPQVELLDAQAEALESKNRLSVLAHRRRALEARLNHLLNRPSEAPVGKTESLREGPVPASAEQLVGRAIENQPDLLVFKFSAERAEASWRLSKRELFPDLETMLKLRDPAMGPIGPWDLSLALALPFWFWTKQSYGVKAALLDKESAQAAYEGARNEVARRIHEHWNDAAAAGETARLCRESLIPLAAQAVSSALAAYQGGKGSFMELMGALRALDERKRVYYEQVALFEQRMALLEQAVGVSLREPEHDGGDPS